jgi:SnoaL-like protein
MIEGPDDQTDIGTADTMALDAMTESGALAGRTSQPPQQPRPQQPQVVQRTLSEEPARKPASRWWLPLVGGVVIGGAAVAIYAFALRDQGDKPHETPQLAVDAAVTVPVAVSGAPSKPTSPQLLLSAEYSALSRADETALGQLVGNAAFAFGVDASQVAYGGPAVAATIMKIVGPAPQGHAVSASGRTHIGVADDVAWIATEVSVDGQKFMTSQLAVRKNDVWHVAAWHWSKLLDNVTAARLSKKGQLPAGAPVRDQADDAKLRAVFTRAFTSRADQLEFLASRNDIVDVGSAPREFNIGSVAVRRFIEGAQPKLAIKDGITVGLVTPKAGWGAANVDFTIKYGNQTYTQTFRVLAGFVDDGSGWKIVMIHWSNGGPT